MKKEIKLLFNECDICSGQEIFRTKISFKYLNDICDECFLRNGGAISNFEFINEKWCVKSKKEGSSSE